jgi:hypothetical protein
MVEIHNLPRLLLQLAEVVEVQEEITLEALLLDKLVVRVAVVVAVLALALVLVGRLHQVKEMQVATLLQAARLIQAVEAVAQEKQEIPTNHQLAR